MAANSQAQWEAKLKAEFNMRQKKHTYSKKIETIIPECMYLPEQVRYRNSLVA
jgi:hypothetical protein